MRRVFELEQHLANAWWARFDARCVINQPHTNKTHAQAAVAMTQSPGDRSCSFNRLNAAAVVTAAAAAAAAAATAVDQTTDNPASVVCKLRCYDVWRLSDI